jgi:hypothetical protein
MTRAVAIVSGLVLAACAFAGQRMDAGVGGLRVDRSANPVFDPKQKLYLFSGGD